MVGRYKRVSLLVAAACAALAFALVANGSPRGRRLARRTARVLTGGHARFALSVNADHFQRGSLHAHSRRSDGTATLAQMVGWYRDHGYQFAAMTEHNLRVDPDELAPLQDDRFVVIAGEEVTNSARGRPVHVNALCATRTVGGAQDFARPRDAIAATMERIRSLGGVPLLNHPNFRWALDEESVATGAQGDYLLEIWSGHPDVQPQGDADHPSAEALWDAVLARGASAAPAAVDDAHQLVLSPEGEGAIPGRAWVETFGEETTRAAICAALGSGRLYASSGPRLTRLVVNGDRITVGTTDRGASVTFVGEKGEELETLPASAGEVTYRLRGGETLVRARVRAEPAGAVHGGESERGQAWTAAYRVISR